MKTTALGASDGTAGLVAVATHPEADIVICASSGTAALEAVLAAIDAGKTIALANKEVLVMAGALVTAAARARGVAILPVDSEHNAIHQCLHGRRPEEIRRIILTASGGPFRELPAARSRRREARRRVASPDLAHGPQDHDRLGHADEQRPRSDRGPLAVRAGRRSHRRRHSPAVDRAFDGGTARRVGHCPARGSGHETADTVCVFLPRALGRPCCKTRSHRVRTARFSAAGFGSVPVPAARVPRAARKARAPRSC